MGNTTKQEILEAIRRTTKKKGGRPLGMDRLENETGIKRATRNADYAILLKKLGVANNNLYAI